MKALMKTKPAVGNVELAEVPEPVCAGQEVKVEVKFTGICGTDLHVFEDAFRDYPPVILGHEFSGDIAEVGSELKSKKAGDQVVVLPAARWFAEDASTAGEDTICFAVFAGAWDMAPTEVSQNTRC